MAFSLNTFFEPSGTRFRLFAQSPVLEAFAEPETIWVSSPAGTVAPGPSDTRMYAVAPIDKKPYEGDDMPPYRGPTQASVLPDPEGHFDYLDVDNPGFRAAHLFGAVRRVLDVWEVYLGGPINWHFASTHTRLEMIPHVPWNNAHFGWGFMECGEGADDLGAMRPFALNFDVIAHEVGHGLVFGLAGMPTSEGLTNAFRGFHESASDCAAMISALHFDSFVAHVLQSTEGDLYVSNAMNRIGELSQSRQIRVASNGLTLDDVRPDHDHADKLTGKEVHALGQPLTGAIFDIGVELFEDRLVEFGLIPRAVAEKTRASVADGRIGDADSTATTGAFHEDPAAFAEALCDARDMLGLRIAETWRRIDPQRLSFARVAQAFAAADRSVSGSEHRAMVAEAFRWRGLDAHA